MPYSESSMAAFHLGGFSMSFCRCFSASRRSRSFCFSARLSSTRLFPAFLSGSSPRLLSASTLTPAAHATPTKQQQTRRAARIAQSTSRREGTRAGKQEQRSPLGNQNAVHRAGAGESQRPTALRPLPDGERPLLTALRVPHTVRSRSACRRRKLRQAELTRGPTP